MATRFENLLTSRRAPLALALGAAAFAAAMSPSSADAQLDINPPLPNVMLMVDTSGSMERMMDGSIPSTGPGVCTPGVPMPQTAWNRWAILVQALTGNLQNFSCYALDRSTDPFKNEFSLSGKKPYDYKYHLPFHRLVSNGCTAGAGQVGAAWFDWLAPNPLDPFNQPGAIKYHAYNDANTPCLVPFAQASPGLLDTFQNQVRFGLMTIDSFPDPGTGASGSAVNNTTGLAGLWSYYKDWNGGGSPATGSIPGCATAIDYEVGARNPAAPPWEGRLIPFGHFDASIAEMQQTNGRIQEALLAMRPYGRTPLGGFFQDAEDFLLYEDFPDQNNAGQFLGPAKDPYFTGGCRPTYLILLSDGEPEPELRPSCQSVNGCPFRTPDVIASELAGLANPVYTYVVGFGVSKQQGVDCTLLGASDFVGAGQCVNPSPALAACCQLAQVAVAGGTNSAFFADDLTGLNAALSTILSQISSKTSTSRTIPAFAAATGATGNAKGFQFVSSFNAPITGELWYGNLERKRYVCPANGPATIATVDPNAGDRFMDNVNMNDPVRPRQFFTAVGSLGLFTGINSDYNMRPYLAQDDGLGTYGSTPVTDDVLRDGPTFSTYVPPAALGINAVSAALSCNAPFGTTQAGPCADRLLRWQVGETNQPYTSETRDVAACPSGKVCSELGAVYHSTPITVGPPREFLRDASYAEFASQAPGYAGLRPLMLYAATIDGQLHAFKVAPTDPADQFKVDVKSNNELWSFIPPVVLPRLFPTYNQQAILLDGATVAKDVVFQRTHAQALAGATSNGGASWSTVLVGSGGQAGGFYYALDVTDPTTPKFLWQLSKDSLGIPMFGTATPPPAIATVAIAQNGSLDEVAVAILSGGSAPQAGGSCQRKTIDYTAVDIDSSDGLHSPRTHVRCWGSAGLLSTGPARAITVVRLDTGEILMNFRGNILDGPVTLNPAKYKVAAFDSPITGIPVPYPAETGSVATRAYVGDSDGTLWRIDLSDSNPANWKVALAWDGYPAPAAYDDGQPINTPPIVSIDASGNHVILFSTGDQELFTSSGAISTRIWSLTEKPFGTGYGSTANWVVPFTNGKRVTGPISLFDSVAYFATFTPTPVNVNSNSCSDGYSEVWGIHFKDAAPPDLSDPCPPDTSDSTITGPYPRGVFPNALNPASFTYCDPNQLTASVVFGVAVAQTPSCSATSSVSDPYFGSHSSITSVSPGTFELVVQTGAGGTAQNSSVTNTSTIPLPSPTRMTKIDSWACILE